MCVPKTSFPCVEYLAIEKLLWIHAILKTLQQASTPSAQDSMLHAIKRGLRSSEPTRTCLSMPSIQQTTQPMKASREHMREEG